MAEQVVSAELKAAIGQETNSFLRILNDAPVVAGSEIDQSEYPMFYDIDLAALGHPVQAIRLFLPDRFLAGNDAPDLARISGIALPECYKIGEDRAMAGLAPLLRLLPGDRVELNTAHDQERLIHRLTQNAGYWVEWKYSENYEYYRKQIHPVVTDCVARCMSDLWQQGRQRIVIADLFGGDGSLVSDMHAMATRMGVIDRVEFHHKDVNPSLVDNAHMKFAKPPLFGRGLPFVWEPLPQYRNVRVHDKQDLTKDTFSGIRTGVDIVTISGGLNRGVINREGALAVLGSVHKNLNPGGYAIITGYSGSWIDANDCQVYGFSVLQKSIPENLAEKKAPMQFYKLQKH